MAEKKNKIIITFGCGKFVIPSENDGQHIDDEDIRDRISFASDMIKERDKSMRRYRR